MKVSEMFMATQREIPADAEIPSHQLMLRAGLIRKAASGIYSFMPLGYRAYRKVEAVIREEMDRAGAQELIMPALLPAEAYQGSGRWEKFGPEMFRLTDRGGRSFCLGPTHEEPFTEAVRDTIRSYKQLPVTLYQIQHKYRDEKRPRFGVIRAREFVMKDAYSFDVDEAGLDVSYQKMYVAYRRIFDRFGLDYTIVDADSGAMGGSGSQEFMVKSEVGEDAICFCDECGYAANEEKAGWTRGEPETAEMLEIEKIHTPDVKTIEELCGYLNCGPEAFVKTILYNIDGKFVAAMCRGDRDINETKLGNLCDATEMELAAFADVEAITGAKVGFAGPVGLKQKIDIVVDPEVAGMKKTLQTLSEKYILGIITSGGYRSTQAFLEKFELGELVSHVISAEDCKYIKPHPMPLIKIAEAANVLPENCLFVGDTIFDILCAKRAGAFSAAVKTGFDSERFLKFHKADFIMESVNDLPGLLMSDDRDKFSKTETVKNADKSKDLV